VLQGWSAHGPILHATVETHGGGPGEHTARIWRDGAMVFTQQGHAHRGPTSMLLQQLGGRHNVHPWLADTLIAWVLAWSCHQGPVLPCRGCSSWW
jgi:hypothetical protein